MIGKKAGLYWNSLTRCHISLTWQDINFEEQYLTVKRSGRYDGAKHKTPPQPLFLGGGGRCFIKKDQESFRSMGISYNTS